MRVAAVALAVAVTAGGCGGAGKLRNRNASPDWSKFERHPAVTALPVIARIEGARTDLVLRGHVPDWRARQLERMALNTYIDVNERFVDDRTPVARPAVDVCIFETNRGYTRFVARVMDGEIPFDYGFYAFERRLVVVNLVRSIGNLRHEIVHALLQDDYEDIPSWLDEGLASLYGAAHWNGGAYEFVDSHRLHHLHDALRRGRVPSLRDLAHSDYHEVHGDEWREYYAMSRYVLFYLYGEGVLEELYRTMRRHRPAPEAQLALLEHYVDFRTFIAWAAEKRPDSRWGGGGTTPSLRDTRRVNARCGESANCRERMRKRGSRRQRQ